MEAKIVILLTESTSRVWLGEVFETRKAAPTWHSVDGSQRSQHTNRPHCWETDALQVEWILQHPGKYTEKAEKKVNTTATSYTLSVFLQLIQSGNKKTENVKALLCSQLYLSMFYKLPPLSLGK